MILADDNFATIVAAVRRRARHLRQHPQVPALPAVVQHGRGADGVLRRAVRARPSACTDGSGAVVSAAAGDADPVDQPDHGFGARAGHGRRPAGRRRDGAQTASPAPIA
ncbi:MAG: hypothetical protein MZU91_12365 [Desulfosudis oleivorans]|nr:hypothetical protein [Desulfosudis oleivorans]